MTTEITQKLHNKYTQFDWFVLTDMGTVKWIGPQEDIEDAMRVANKRYGGSFTWVMQLEDVLKILDSIEEL